MAVTEGLAARRGARLLEEAGRLRSVAAGLAGVADDVERRLDPVVEDVGPPIWTGRAAAVAAEAGEAARADLWVAAGSLRDVARELDLAAAALEWRADGVPGGGIAPRPATGEGGW